MTLALRSAPTRFPSFARRPPRAPSRPPRSPCHPLPIRPSSSLLPFPRKDAPVNPMDPFDDELDIDELAADVRPVPGAATEVPLDELVDDSPLSGRRETIEENSQLPLRHFRLTAHPFMDSVNPEFFFRTQAHEEAFIQMKRCIEDNVSLGLATAISGAGKTLLTQVLLQELDPRRYKAILVLAYPGMTRTGLLREIMNEMGLEGGDRPRAQLHDMIASIQQRIVDLYGEGVRLVLVIDEVHFLSAEALHVLRTLSNIELPENKLVTVLLFGERVFLDKMKHPSFRSIFSRMFVRAEIRPLMPDEVRQYVKFRLLLAGGSPAMFSGDALDALAKASAGIPREINRIGHNAMSIAAREGRPVVDGAIVRRIPAAQPIE